MDNLSKFIPLHNQRSLKTLSVLHFPLKINGKEKMLPLTIYNIPAPGLGLNPLFLCSYQFHNIQYAII